MTQTTETPVETVEIAEIVEPADLNIPPADEAPAVEPTAPHAATAPIGFELFAPYNENVRLLGSWNA